eukprot:scaffold64966_cov18-Tisochrysis_lutea.AAC.2
MAVLLNKADLISEEAVDELASWYKENCRADKVSMSANVRKRQPIPLAFKELASWNKEHCMVDQASSCYGASKQPISLAVNKLAS